MRDAADRLRHGNHPRQGARRAQQGEPRVPPEGVAAAQVDDEGQASCWSGAGRGARGRALSGESTGEMSRSKYWRTHYSLIRSSQLWRAMKWMSSGGQRRQQHLVEQPVLALDERMGAGGDRPHLLLGGQPVDRPAPSTPPAIFCLIPATRHLEELVEVAARDAQEAEPLEQRHLFVAREGEHPLVEGEEAQLAVGQQRRPRGPDAGTSRVGAVFFAARRTRASPFGPLPPPPMPSRSPPLFSFAAGRPFGGDRIPSARPVALTPFAGVPSGTPPPAPIASRAASQSVAMTSSEGQKRSNGSLRRSITGLMSIAAVARGAILAERRDKPLERAPDGGRLGVPLEQALARQPGGEIRRGRSGSTAA